MSEQQPKDVSLEMEHAVILGFRLKDVTQDGEVVFTDMCGNTYVVGDAAVVSYGDLRAHFAEELGVVLDD